MSKAVTRRTGRGARRLAPLPLLAGLLIASCLLRLTGLPARAIADEIKAAMQSQPAAETVAEPAAKDRIAELLASLESRDEKLAEREGAIAARETALADAESKISAQLAKLEAAEADLEKLLKLAGTAAEDDLAKLTTVYETMKPAEAAALFSTMEPTFAAGFLGRMRPDAAAAVLAGLDPERAYAISLMLAGRNAEVPKAAEGLPSANEPQSAKIPG